MPDKEGWRRFVPSWKVVAGAFGLGTLGMFALVGVAYAKTPVPAEGTKDATAEAAILYYSDNTEMARLGTTRVSVPIKDIPQHVQFAVLSAENREFYNERGVSPTGLARAVWNNVSGGETQGGSTITQQLAKKYYLTDERTLTRKGKELFIALKLEQKNSKQEILQLYLNTIYFGRGANGIEAAARAYFRDKPRGKGTKHANTLTPDEGALLAAMIQLPSQYEPFGPNRAATEARYRYVLDGMVEMGKIDAASAAKYKQRLPRTLKKPGQDNLYGGQRGYMIRQVIDELERKGIDEETVYKRSLRVHTTFDKRMMQQAKIAAEKTIPAVSPSNPKNKRIQVGLVSVEPGTGRVRALYGGEDYLKHEFDNVFRARVQPGSSFKPYVLAAALKQGTGLKSLVEGGSPRYFSNRGDMSNAPSNDFKYRVKNNDNEQFGVIDLVKATENSVNTAYVQLGLKTGLDNVTDTAEEAGMPESTFKSYQGQAGISLGIAEVRPIDQAAGFATFANGGEYVEPHVIDKVETNTNTEYIKMSWEKHQAFPEGVAADATFAMEQVVKSGTGRLAALPGRPVAGKTGTTEKNKAAWFVGFTPQMSTAVTVFDSKGKPMIIPGQGPVFGGTFSAKIWRAFMEPAMRGKEAEAFSSPQWVGSQERFATPKPTPRPSTPGPPCRPGLPNFPQCLQSQQPSQNPNCPPFDPNCQPSPAPTQTAPPQVCQRPDPPPFCPPRDDDGEEQPRLEANKIEPAIRDRE